MLTRVIKINPGKPELSKIALAAKVIKSGGTVVFPTETVYGIGADATSPAAVKKIYEAKGRPSDNPMIVHIYSARELFNLSLNLPQKATKLTQKFWPGPLTIVVKKAKTIPNEVTSGLDTVAIRMPSHPVARALLKASGVPIAAPSANVSGSPSLQRRPIMQ
jgi:L-threonylcarbamoyladenylate synthase